MSATIMWFIAVLAALPAMWFAGRLAARIADPMRRSLVIGSAVLLLIGWSILIHHPAVAVELLPLSVLARIEGIGAAPLFVFILSVGWELATVRRQRAVLLMGMLLGLGYFVQGGLWMMRPTPTNAFSPSSDTYLVFQTQDYSCVPAASATALRILGFGATESDMARLTETRPGSGATLLRALNGLNQRLRHSSIQPRLLEPSYDELMRLETPILTALRYEASQLHMVTLIEVRPSGVVLFDPQVGIETLRRSEFEQLYRGQVIAFEGQIKRPPTQEIINSDPSNFGPDHDPIAKR